MAKVKRGITEDEDEGGDDDDDDEVDELRGMDKARQQ